MSAHSFSPYPPLGAPGAAIGRLRGQFTPLLLIAAVHALVLYGAYSGLLHRVAQAALPAAVFVSFVATPPPPPEPEPAQLAEVPTLAPPDVPVPTTVINIAPAQPVASVAAPAGAVGEAAGPAVSATAAVSAEAPVAPAPPAAPRTITAVDYLKPPQPEYPAQSRRLGEQGKVVLRILVNEKGLPEQVLVQSSSGFARLDEAGRQAALRAQFKPHLEDGRPVAVYVMVPLNFQLGR